MQDSLDEMFDKKTAATVEEPAKAPPTPPIEAPKEPSKEESGDEKFVDDMIEGVGEPEEVKPTEEKKPDAAKEPPKEEPARSFKTPKEMRQYLKEVNKEKFQLVERNAKLARENEELKKGGGSSAEVKALADQLAQEQKVRQQLEEKLGGFDYASTTEFQQKYQEPLRQAVDRASKFVPQLEVNVTDENGEPTVRPASWADFQALYQLPPGKVDKVAHEMFGHAAPRVIQHLDRIKELGEIADQAQSNAVNMAKERQQKMTAEQAQVLEIQVKSFHEATKGLMEKYPEYFGESEDDPEGSEMFKKGLAWADQFFSGKAASLPPEKRAQMDAMIRLRAAGFSRLAASNKSLKAQLAKAKTELEGIRSTKPKMGNDSLGDAPKRNEADIFSGIDSIPDARR